MGQMSPSGILSIAFLVSMNFGIDGCAWKSGIPSSLHDLPNGVCILDECDGEHLCYKLRTFQRVNFTEALYAPSLRTLLELSSIGTLWSMMRRREDFSAVTSSPAGVPAIIRGQRFVGFRM